MRDNYLPSVERWRDDGFVLLRGFFSRDRVGTANALIDRLWSERRKFLCPVTIDVGIECRDQRRILLKDADESDRLRPYKINDLYLEYPEIRDLVLDERLCQVLRTLFKGTPMVCNTLNFEYGSQQLDHIDTLYMPSRKPGGMVASWIALDKITQDNGPLRYWPGSHRIPPYYFSHGKTNAVADEMPEFNAYIEREVDRRGLRAETLDAEPGDVFIWHSQLLHGGCPIKDLGMTRRSLVTHYFRRQDYRHHFWRLRRHHPDGCFYRRRHQAVDAEAPE